MQIPFQGVAVNISNQEYHAAKDYISRSALIDFDKSPYMYWANHLNPERPKRESTPQMILGSAFHTLILEPKLFDKMYVVKPKPVFLKDVGREIYDKYKSSCEFLERSGSTILTSEQSDNLLGMQEAIRRNSNAMQLIEGARIENSFFWQDEHSGLYVKSRPDILHDTMIVDLKTCADASPRAFQRAMVDGFYHVQGAMIRDGVEKLEGNRINTVINIAVESKYPYNMAIYIIDEFALDEGHMKYKQLLLDLKNCIEENSFKDYGIQTISLPKWALL